MATASGIIPLFPYLQQQQAQQRRTQDQERRAREERRNKRNAEYARRSRERKKLEQTALEQELRELQRENAFLRRTVKENLPDKNAQKILHRRDDLHRSDFELLESVAATRQSYCISDPRLPDNPIVYVSDAFCLLTGYSREQVIGRNCRILQGPETNPKAVEVLREAIQQGTDCTTVILNYKADGTPFWNRIFVAALRDKNRNIINYVGVQCEQDELDDAPSRAKRQKTDPNSRPSLPVVVRRDPLPVVPSSSLEAVKNRPQMSFNEDDFALTENLDWALLAQALEDDLPEDLSIDNLSFEESSRSSPLPDNFLVPSMSLVGDHEIPSSDLVPTQSFHNSYLDRFAATPLEIISRTVRGTVIGTLLNSHGDVKDKHFDAALSVLSKLYSSLGHNASPTNLYTGTWRELNRPHYRECLGQNKHGDFMYSLGRMSFDMFKPGKLKCSVQRTLNHIELVCELDGAPSAAPWSLRRELAAWDPSNDDDQKDTSSRANTLLKSYDIAVALTVEPDGQLPLRALNVTKGYMLPDPKTPNRLTVFFTGGTLSPAPPSPEDSQQYGSLDDWKTVFGGDHKRSWSESFRVMGAKLLVGAELPDGMEEDGTMKYTLRRPAGGHGRTFVDVRYLDDDLLVLKSSSGIIHVMVRSNDATKAEMPRVAKKRKFEE